jgi:hypothetical protein
MIHPEFLMGKKDVRSKHSPSIIQDICVNTINTMEWKNFIEITTSIPHEKQKNNSIGGFILFPR